MGRYGFELYMQICASKIWPWRIRTLLYRLSGMKIAADSAIHGGGYFSGNRLVLGQGSYINRNCLIDCQNESVTIGNRVGIAFAVNIYTTNHDYTDETKRTGPVHGKPVVIEDSVWVSGNAVICPGVRIGKGCIIAAGSVVTQDCAPNGLYAGNPARRVKELPTQNDRRNEDV